MSPELEIHPIQAQILRTLLFQTEARFSQLNTTKMPTDHFTFHLQRLVKIKLVKKTDHHTYHLTPSGKEFANRFDTDQVALERQAKITVLVVAVKNKGSRQQFLIQQRLKQPFYGFHGFVTGKAKWGETILGTAARELKEETNLAGKATLVGVEHKTDYSTENQILEDKYFFIVRVDQPKGKLKNTFEGGKNQWLTKKETLSLSRLFGDIESIFEILDQNQLCFLEKKYTVSRY